MIVFLTSSPGGIYYDGEKRMVCEWDSSNGFVEELQQVWKEDSRCLMIASDPDAMEKNEYYREVMAQSIALSGLSIAEMNLCDGRNPEMTAESLHKYDVVILSGGHVPTQNAFFAVLHLREALQNYEGIVIGISAGTMNSAEEVYAMPEREGESKDPEYERFLMGLGLTDIMVIPHFQEICETVLDGKQAVEEIACPDSMGRCFCGLPDGSYLLIWDGKTKLYGEAYLIQDGEVSALGEKGSVIEV
ncbi:MAG TPA: dipeptidase E [Lachnospiraceae bacterium]|nr:dipeptidase E [Lachnospiraceae bacterium]